MSEIIYGSELAKKLKGQMKEKIDHIKEMGERVPCLCVILVGDDPASQSYVKGKEKACNEIGILSKMITLDGTTSEETLLEVIKENNNDDSVDGILVQLPLPKHISRKNIIEAIDPTKDVDGLHSTNVSKLYNNENDGFVPCTPLGIMSMLHESNTEIDGKQVCVVGRSQLVGSPVSRLLLNENATVTICHSHTRNLSEVTKQADILVACVGKAKMLTKEHVKEGAVVIDVGVNRMENGKLCGDVDFDNVKDIVAKISPVPKGVGPMTITMLLENTLKAYALHTK